MTVTLGQGYDSSVIAPSDAAVARRRQPRAGTRASHRNPYSAPVTRTPRRLRQARCPQNWRGAARPARRAGSTPVRRRRRLRAGTRTPLRCPALRAGYGRRGVGEGGRGVAGVAQGRGSGTGSREWRGERAARLCAADADFAPEPGSRAGVSHSAPVTDGAVREKVAQGHGFGAGSAPGAGRRAGSRAPRRLRQARGEYPRRGVGWPGVGASPQARGATVNAMNHVPRWGAVRARVVVALAVTGVALAGCGSSPAPAPDLSAGTPTAVTGTSSPAPTVSPSARPSRDRKSVV